MRAAGTFELGAQAELEEVTPKSGHYRPGPIQMIHAVIGLKKNDANLGRVRIKPTFQGSSVKASKIYDALLGEQRNKWQTVPKDPDDVKKLTGPIKVRACKNAEPAMGVNTPVLPNELNGIGLPNGSVPRAWYRMTAVPDAGGPIGAANPGSEKIAEIV